MSDIERIDALRGEIRQTARTMADLQRRRLRPRLIWSGVGVAVAGGLIALMMSHPDYLVLLVFAHAFMLPFVLGIVGVVVHADATSKTAAELREREQRLADRLRSLPSDQVAVALMPLRADAESDVRALAKRLVREIDLRTELIPTPAPGGRGDEPAHTCGA